MQLLENYLVEFHSYPIINYKPISKITIQNIYTSISQTQTSSSKNISPILMLHKNKIIIYFFFIIDFINIINNKQMSRS